jgi:enoyl-CoA hydratase/carnithine racemase
MLIAQTCQAAVRVRNLSYTGPGQRGSIELPIVSHQTARLETGELKIMSASASAGVSLLIHDALATISFDQRLTHNAMKLSTWLALPALVAAAEHHAAVRLIILRGARGNFGTGNDIAEFGAVHGDPAAAKAFGRAMADAMQVVDAASKPVLVAIEGFCYGASVALALAGDVRIAASNASIAITPAKLGALYLQSDLHRLVAAVGLGRSKQLIYSAQPVSADRAYEIGLVDEVIAAEQFDMELKLLTDAILGGSSLTLRRSKQMLRLVNPTPAETDESLASFVEATQGDDFLEGVSAFLAKRPPRFRRPSV